MGKKQKNHFYAYITAEGRGIVSSWPACEGRVSGRKARYRGFPDRSSAERWLESDGDDAVARKPGPKKFYAYRMADEEGVVDTWSACERKIDGQEARYRSFPSEAAARRWLASGAQYADRAAAKSEALAALPEDAVFFDSGTGPGRGAEVRVTDRSGAPLLHLAGELPDEGTVAIEGNLILGHRRTNNYGELLGCLLALRVATHMGSKSIYGDSQLVLDYWSKGRVSATKRESDPALAVLARDVARERRDFERNDGHLEHVSGGINPADLGYHRD